MGTPFNFGTGNGRKVSPSIHCNSPPWPGLESNGYRVRPIIRSQLVHQVLDMKIDGRLRNRQLIRDLFIAIAVSDQPENFELPFRKVLFPQMLSKASGYFWRHMPISSVNRSDHTQ